MWNASPCDNSAARGCVEDQPQRSRSFNALETSNVLRLVEDDTAALRKLVNRNFHSARKASTGLIRAARYAGRKPAMTPVTVIRRWRAPRRSETFAWAKTFFMPRLAPHATPRPMSPPNKQIAAASIKNWIKIVSSLRANRFADTDLFRALGHRDEHDVHDPDSTDEERQARDEKARPPR